MKCNVTQLSEYVHSRFEAFIASSTESFLNCCMLLGLWDMVFVFDVTGAWWQNAG